MEDCRIVREVGERRVFRDAFEHQHRKRVCVGMGRWRDGYSAVELGGGIS